MKQSLCIILGIPFSSVHHDLKHHHSGLVPGVMNHPLVPGPALHMDQLAYEDTTGERIDTVKGKTLLLTLLVILGAQVL